MTPAHSRTRAPWAIAAIAIVACAGIASTCPGIPHRVFFNPTESAPRGWYWLAGSPSYEPGTYAISFLPQPAANLAHVRRYIPRTIPVLKRIAATPGDRVCEIEGNVVINGRRVARALAFDGSGRALQSWNGCYRLRPREYFLLNPDSAQSFDSRYFGPINGSMLVGTAIPIWTW